MKAVVKVELFFECVSKTDFDIRDIKLQIEEVMNRKAMNVFPEKTSGITLFDSLESKSLLTGLPGTKKTEVTVIALSEKEAYNRLR